MEVPGPGVFFLFAGIAATLIGQLRGRRVRPKPTLLRRLGLVRGHAFAAVHHDVVLFAHVAGAVVRVVVVVEIVPAAAVEVAVPFRVFAAKVVVEILPCGVQGVHRKRVQLVTRGILFCFCFFVRLLCVV